MKITVILCTYNRCQRLAKALQSVAQSRVPESIEWNVLVVDNNSKDQTRQVVEDFAQRYPGRFAYFFEGHPGKSYALNSGISEAKADIFAFMDDDVEVDPHWLDNLTKVLVDGAWSGAGGRILPEAGFTPPAWLNVKERYALAPLAVFDHGSEAGQLKEAPFGTNMAYRKEVFAKYGGFRTDFGPQPGASIQHNEDSEFGSRLLARGERFWYQPSAVVYHCVSTERLQKAYFLKWWYDKVRADMRQDGVPAASLYVAGVPSYFLRRFALWSLRWLCSFGSAQRFSCKLHVWRNLGMIRECRRIALSSAKDARQPAPLSH
jgi:glycosyltransferase involved in cell wall biosynthesis